MKNRPGDIILAMTDAGDLTQSGPLQVTGASDLQATVGNITLSNADNQFDDKVSVDTTGALKLTANGPLVMDKVAVGLDADLKSVGSLNLGTGTYGKKLKANSGGFEISQAGKINFNGDTDFDAGSAKIDLFNPYNQWRGAILFKGGIILINHPVLMNAVNAGTLNRRAEMSSSATSFAPSAAASGGRSPLLQPIPTKTMTGPAVSISVDKATANSAVSMITVALSAETAAPGRSFSFELDAKAMANQPTESSIKVSQSDGQPLPDWLRYEPTTKTFTAKEVPAGAFPIQLKVGVGSQETMMVIQEQDARR